MCDPCSGHSTQNRDMVDGCSYGGHMIDDCGHDGHDMVEPLLVMQMMIT